MRLSLSKTAEGSAVATSLGLYAVILGYVIPRHEPWADEAQAWELASHLSLKSLFGKYIHYEGSPGLWHLLLWIMARLNVSYSGLHWLTALIAFGGVALLALAAPFPLPVRLALPFTYFLLYQYAVIARSYVLFPILVFLIAHTWKQRWQRPFLIAILVGLLANVSIHGFGVAVGLSLVLLYENWRADRAAAQRPLLWAAVTLLCMLGFAFWCILPARDAGWVVRFKEMNDHAARVGQVNDQLVVHPWLRLFSSRVQSFLSSVVEYVFALTRGLSFRFHLGLITWLLFAIYLRLTRQLQYLVPAIILGFLCPPTSFHFYHSGLPWILFLGLWWITWKGANEGPNHLVRRISLFLVTISVSLCILIQLSWAYGAVRYDLANPYSPARDGAKVLGDYLRRGQTVDVAVPSRRDGEGTGDFYVTGMQPYFSTQPFANLTHRFWFWGWGDDPRPKYLVDSQNKSAVIVVEETSEDPRYRIEEKYLVALGYHRDHVVCGQMHYPDTDKDRLCHAFFTL